MATRWARAHQRLVSESAATQVPMTIHRGQKGPELCKVGPIPTEFSEKLLAPIPPTGNFCLLGKQPSGLRNLPVSGLLPLQIQLDT